MPSSLVLHADTAKELDRASKSESHALLLEGPEHIGKALMALELSAKLLNVTTKALTVSPKFLLINPEAGGISAEEIRALNHFFSLKETGRNAVNRVACIIDADRMNHVAQNALLKLLEEPPEDTVIILTSSHTGGLLPTITSRVQRIIIKKPSKDQLLQHFQDAYPADHVERAITLGNGAIGLVTTMLGGDDSSVITLVRDTLALSLYDQLLLIDTELKDKAIAQDFVATLAKMATVSLRTSSNNQAAAAQWKRISSAAYAANEALQANANNKLVLTELMLSLRA